MDLLPQAERESSWADTPAGSTALALLCAAAVAGVCAPALARVERGLLDAAVLGFLFACSIVGVAVAAVRRRAETAPMLPAAAWLAPLALFAWAGSWAALPVAIVFASLTSGLFRGLVREDEPAPVKSFLLAPPALPEEQRRAWATRIATAFGYCGLALAVTGSVVAGAALVAGAVAIVVWFRTANGASRQRAKAAVALAATVVALLPQNWAGYRAMRPPSDEAGEGGPRVPKLPNLHSGVVLLTDAKYEPPLEAPPLPRLSQSMRPARPASIEFSGEYWYFFWPLRGPGEDALRKLGSPLTLAYNAVDMSSLIMQARQPLPKAMMLSRCSAIEVELASNEGDPGSVRVELILLDHSRKPAPRSSLGYRRLASQPGAPVTVRFEVAAEGNLDRFDELVVWFHLDPSRQAHSARLAVQRFHLIP